MTVNLGPRSHGCGARQRAGFDTRLPARTGSTRMFRIFAGRFHTNGLKVLDEFVSHIAQCLRHSRMKCFAQVVAAMSAAEMFNPKKNAAFAAFSSTNVELVERLGLTRHSAR
jgi:hypothetical protein